MVSIKDTDTGNFGYHLNFTANSCDGSPTLFYSTVPVEVGHIIETPGESLFYGVLAVSHQSNGPNLHLSRAYDSFNEALTESTGIET